MVFGTLLGSWLTTAEDEVGDNIIKKLHNDSIRLTVLKDMIHWHGFYHLLLDVVP